MLEHPTATAPISSLGSRPRALLIGGLGVLIIWIILIAQFHSEWSLNPEYTYGWAVPFLCGYLFLRRGMGLKDQRTKGLKDQGTEGGRNEGTEGPKDHGTTERGSASVISASPTSPTSDFQPRTSDLGPPTSDLRPPTSPPSPSYRRTDAPTHRRTILLALSFLAILYLPTRIILEANPGWGFATWPLALEVIGITLLLLYAMGGSRWLREFAFPVCFFLVAVPWPYGIRELVVQGLTRLNIGLGVEILDWVGVPAMQKGNVIEIATGAVGIEEACSGIRSLQATLMIGLFFGELHRFTVRKRIYLVLSGIGLAFLFNVIRALLLVSVASREGLDALHKWHDPVGVPILVGCFVGVWLIATLMQRRSEGGGREAEVGGRRSVVGGRRSDLGPRISEVGGRKADLGPRISVVGSRRSVVGNWGWGAALAMAGWFVMSEVATVAWYRVHAQASPPTPEWTAAQPAGATDFKEVTVPQATSEMLRYDSGKALRWADADGRRWQMFYFRWLPTRQQRDVELAMSHRPEICLPASGYTLKADLGLEPVEVAGLRLPFRTYVFEQGGESVHVFRCIAEDNSRRVDPGRQFSNSGRRERLQAAWDGRLRSGARVLELGVWGCRDLAEAKAAFRGVLAEIVRR